jgi:hypothetical protein
VSLSLDARPNSLCTSIGCDALRPAAWYWSWSLVSAKRQLAPGFAAGSSLLDLRMHATSCATPLANRYSQYLPIQRDGTYPHPSRLLELLVRVSCICICPSRCLLPVCQWRCLGHESATTWTSGHARLATRSGRARSLALTTRMISV